MNLCKPVSPQALRVLSHMQSAGSISNVEANAVHRVRSVSRRMTEIVSALNGSGFRVSKEHKRDVTNQRYVRYFLVREDATQTA